MVQATITRLSDIPNEFNESEDDGIILRTIVDFRLFNSDGEMISFTEIGEGKPPVRLEGNLIEPLPESCQEKLMEILCSRPPPPQSISAGVVSALPPTPVPISDWDQLQVGDLIDGYCTRTLKWYDAKILEIEKEISPDNPGGKAKSFKIHFKRWKSKYDEWIPRDSPRLSVHGTSTEKKEIPYSAYTPWFENSLAFQKLEELVGPLPKRKTIPISIDGIEDCCLDFMYANPSLWVIASDNSWYRLAGPLVFSGCRPHTLYEPLFSPYIHKFIATAHVAYCLIDFLPQNRKLSLNDVVTEIETRTGGLVNEHTILSNYEFIAQQIETLVHPDDWDQQINFTDTLFLTQLKKKGPSYQKSQSRIPPPAKLSRHLLDQSMWKQHSSEEIKPRSKRTSTSKSSKSSISVEEDPIGGQRTSKGTPIPFPDEELWQNQLKNGITSLPYPFEDKELVKDPIRSHLSEVEMSFLPLVLRIWSILHNYRSLLPTIPNYSLEELLSLLLEGSKNETPSSSQSSSSSASRILLQEIHIACLELVLKDRCLSDLSFTPVLTSQKKRNHLFRLPSFQNNDTIDGSEGIQGTSIQNSVTLWEILSSQNEEKINLNSLLRTGDSWVEVGKLLLTERSQYLTTESDEIMIAPEYADMVGELALLIDSLARSSSAQSLNLSFDTEKSNSLKPTSFTTITERIWNGYYEVKNPSSSSSADSNEQDFIGYYGQKILVDTHVDSFCLDTRCWHEARVIEIISKEKANYFVKIVFLHSWIHPTETIVDLTSRWIAPLYTLSVSDQYRRVHPNSLPNNFITNLRQICEERSLKRNSTILSSLTAIANEVRDLLQRKLNEINEDPTGNPSQSQAISQLQKSFENGYSMLLSEYDRTNLTSSSHHLNSIDLLLDSLGTKTLRQSTLFSLYSNLSSLPYSHFSFQSRVLFLNWICGEMICSSTAKLFIDDIAERKWKIEKDFKSKRQQITVPELETDDNEREQQQQQQRNGKEEELEAEEDGEYRTSQRSSRNKRGRSENPVKAEPSTPTKRGKLKHNPTIEITQSGNNLAEEEAFLSQIELRYQPFGIDRHLRKYWRFPHDKHPMRLLCEGPGGEDWFILSTQTQSDELVNWLSIWGKNESKLKHALLSWESPVNGSTNDYDNTFPLLDTHFQNRYSAFLNPTELSSQSQTQGASIHQIQLKLNENGQIEAGVKDIEGRIILTTFKFNLETNQSAAHSSGLKIADQFLSVDGVWIEDIHTLQRTLKLAQSNHISSSSSLTSSSCAVLNVLVLRYHQPLRCSLLRQATESDPEFKKWVDPKSSSFSSSSSLQRRHHQFQESEVSFSPLLGPLIELLYALREPWITHTMWGIEMEAMMEKLMKHLTTTQSSNNSLVAILKSILLHIEDGLWVHKRCLKKWWMENRIHLRWRSATMSASSFPCICSSFAILQQAIDWSLVENIQSCLPLSKCRELFPKQSMESYLPTIGDTFLYYPDGHKACLDILRFRYDFELPLSRFQSQTIDSLSGRVFYCQALTLRYYPGGVKGVSNKSCCPYSRLEFRVLSPSNEESLPPMPPPVDMTSQVDKHEMKRYRLFNRVLNILYGLPEAELFINPVSAVECPDYYEIITTPMNLVEVTRRVKQHFYHSPIDFLSDIQLIRSNCIQYCSSKFPTLVTDVEVLYSVAVSALEKMKEEFNSCTHTSTTRDTAHDMTTMEIVKSSETVTPTPPNQFLGEIWTIFVPMNKSLTEIDFLVSLAVYSKACSRRQYHLEDKVCMRKGTFHSASAGQHNSSSDSLEAQYGSIVGCKPSGVDPFLPWRWLKVEWDLLDDLFSEVNPWEILMALNKTSPSSSNEDENRGVVA